MQFTQKLDQLEKRFDELNAADGRSGRDRRRGAIPQSHQGAERASPKWWASTASGRRSTDELRRPAPCCRTATPSCGPWPKRKSRSSEPELARIEEELKVLLLPKDPNDDKNVVLEIRAGTGGDEATLFAAEIFRMYARYAESQGWKMEVTSSSESPWAA